MSVYGALWRRLPGPTAVRVLLALALALAVVAVCFRWVFPAVAPSVPWNSGTVEVAAPMTASVPAAPAPPPADRPPS
ncbi:hypothetical protein [uncultured Pseudokineococcus sp.]|uniref:hypothetical protein n=1 Tax=uncultured Pseudokineococcus sp. TaxID=1642928 RepID=UPI002608F20A|nr:hypothetical protein [uncultured Pseudokineococcus sp.]